MAMNSSLKSYLLCSTTIIITLLFHLLPPVACSIQKQLNSDATRGLLFEGKSRLGSTPPSCHNKCNQCHPCWAVQVPTMPSHDRFQPDQSRVIPMKYFDSSSSSSHSGSSNKYSNYKPLGWKCRCGDHFFNP